MSHVTLWYIIYIDAQICLSPARTFFKHDELAGDCHGNKTTPTTIWSLQPDHTEEEGEGESTMSSSQYNECWQSTSTVKTSKQDEEEEEVEEVEEGEGRGEGEEGEGEGEEGGQDVDGATGQSTIAKSVTSRLHRSCTQPLVSRSCPSVYCACLYTCITQLISLVV